MKPKSWSDVSDDNLVLWLKGAVSVKYSLDLETFHEKCNVKYLISKFLGLSHVEMTMFQIHWIK